LTIVDHPASLSCLEITIACSENCENRDTLKMVFIELHNINVYFYRRCVLIIIQGRSISKDSLS